MDRDGESVVDIRFDQEEISYHSCKSSLENSQVFNQAQPTSSNGLNQAQPTSSHDLDQTHPTSFTVMAKPDEDDVDKRNADNLDDMQNIKHKQFTENVHTTNNQTPLFCAERDQQGFRNDEQLNKRSYQDMIATMEKQDDHSTSIDSIELKRARLSRDTSHGKRPSHIGSGGPSAGGSEKLLFYEDSKHVHGKKKSLKKHDEPKCREVSRPSIDVVSSECSHPRLTGKWSHSSVSVPASKSVSSRDSTPRKHAVDSHTAQSHNTSILSEGPVCRICHEGDSAEVLISPCYCAGSLGLLHVSCLQTWLGSSNKTTCEICNFQFALERRTMPIKQFFKEPGSSREKKNLWFDLVAFCLITPTTIVTTWICLAGAIKYYHDAAWERTGLISLAVSLIILYSVWITVVSRHNWHLWQSWKLYHQEVTLVCEPQQPPKQPNIQGPGMVSGSEQAHGTIHLQSIKFNVTQPKVTRSRASTSHSSHRKHGAHLESASERKLGHISKGQGLVEKDSQCNTQTINNKVVLQKQTNQDPKSFGNSIQGTCGNQPGHEIVTYINTYTKGQGHLYGNKHSENQYYNDIDLKGESTKNQNERLIEEYLDQQEWQACDTVECVGSISPGNIAPEEGAIGGCHSYTASWVNGQGKTRTHGTNNSNAGYYVNWDGSVAV